MLNTDNTLTRTYAYCLLVPWPCPRSALVHVHWAKAKDCAEHCVVPCLAISVWGMNWEEQILWYSSLGTEIPDPAPCWLLQKSLCNGKSGERSHVDYKYPTPSISLWVAHCKGKFPVIWYMGKRCGKSSLTSSLSACAEPGSLNEIHQQILRLPHKLAWSSHCVYCAGL